MSTNLERDDRCGCGGPRLPRRAFVKCVGLGAAASALRGLPAFAGPFVREDFARLIPPEKKLRPEWLASLTARGAPETFSGEDLRFIGMPVGGLCAGTLYLAGDGRLWLWDVFNEHRLGAVAKQVEFAGGRINAQNGANYVRPSECDEVRPVAQGFAVRVRAGGREVVRTLDRHRIRDVRFTGEYPIGRVSYRDPNLPVRIDLEAFSPFIPLELDESSLPVTLFEFTVSNEGPAEAEVTLGGWLENAVGLHQRGTPGRRRNEIMDLAGGTLLLARAESDETAQAAPRPDLTLEDWSRSAYEGWKAEGDAFGSGPVARKDIPSYQGDVGGDTERVVNSHATAPGEGVGPKDGRTGRLTSRPFRIKRRYLGLWIGGGGHKDRTCLNLRVDGKVVASATGRNNNRMEKAWLDAREWEGRDAVIEIVDNVEGAWGNIGVGRIWQTDRRGDEPPWAERPDVGTMGLALLDAPADLRLARAKGHGLDGEAVAQAEAPLVEHLVGLLGRTLRLPPGASARASFAVVWHFPNLVIRGIPERGRFYGARFADARAVAEHVATHHERLARLTRLWRDTWYDSTFPHWFLNRTFANTSILATNTCYRLAGGRFWAWEGIGCCPGTCAHVWHYAQAPGRLFPALERDQRERVDFGIAFDPKTGAIRFRAEHNDRMAIDAQAGRVLGVLREHQMSADDGFLRRLWPRVRRATETMIDIDADRDGLVRGPLHNTLDADWFGIVPWVNGLYHAALRAAEAMAGEMGDAEFAARCRSILDAAPRNLDAQCWNEDFQYYIHRGDDAHAQEVGAYEGCHIDQVMGQGWAWQVGIGRVMTEAHAKAALRSLWRYNFTPDVGPFRQARKAGRWYAMAGDGGLIMVTFPFVPEREIKGGGAWSTMYFNECMSGFEHQAASHMVWEGLVTEGLAVTRAIHDRYHPRLRNPYNEVECSDHYARAMASYGTFLAACGWECHGPKRHVGFAPRLGPDDFRAAFTAAEGWGTIAQTATERKLSATVSVKCGRLALRTLALAWPGGPAAPKATVRLGGREIPARTQRDGDRVTVTLATEATVPQNTSLEIALA